MKFDWVPYVIGFVALLFAPLIICYAVGAFGCWDLTWIAATENADVRGFTAVVNVIWIVMLGIAMSGS